MLFLKFDFPGVEMARGEVDSSPPVVWEEHLFLRSDAIKEPWNKLYDSNKGHME